MGNGAVIAAYITRKEACEITGFSESTISKHFKIIREKNPNSLVFKGRVNRNDFYKHFNINSFYKAGNKNKEEKQNEK